MDSCRRAEPAQAHVPNTEDAGWQRPRTSSSPFLAAPWPRRSLKRSGSTSVPGAPMPGCVAPATGQCLRYHLLVHE